MSDHQHLVVAPGDGCFYCISCGAELAAQEANICLQEQAKQPSQRCEACGKLFRVETGYYEPGEYAYCGDCCHW